MGSITNSVGALTLFVGDLTACKDFYGSVFDTSVVHEDQDSVVFGFGATVINLLRVEAAAGLVEPGAVGDRHDGIRTVFSIWVDDVDSICAELAEKGVALLNGPQDREWGLRTAAFCDPAGHVWEIAQSLSG